ncbi:unnamed protein product, partial [Symbiodinium necroappetens]
APTVVPPKFGATVVPPRMAMGSMGPPKAIPPRRPATTAAEVLQEVNEKQETPGKEPQPRQPGGRGARPNRPSQKNRETGRSFERLADRLLTANEKLLTETAALQWQEAQNFELRSQMQEQEANFAQQLQLLTQQKEQLETANLQANAAHQQLLASLPELSQSGQYKQLYLNAEACRAELQGRLEKVTGDNLKQMQVMLDEKQKAAEERRAQLIKEHVRQLQGKEAELKAQRQELTALTEEVLQKDAEITALKKQQQ